MRLFQAACLLASLIPLTRAACETTHTYGACADHTVHWYDPDTCEICDPPECGEGAMAGPENACPSTTAPSSASYMSCCLATLHQGSSPMTNVAMSTSPASPTPDLPASTPSPASGPQSSPSPSPASPSPTSPSSRPMPSSPPSAKASTATPEQGSATAKAPQTTQAPSTISLASGNGTTTAASPTGTNGADRMLGGSLFGAIAAAAGIVALV